MHNHAVSFTHKTKTLKFDVKIRHKFQLRSILKITFGEVSAEVALGLLSVVFQSL